MYLDRSFILEEIKNDRIRLDPFDPEQVAQSSVDVHLHRLLYVYNGKRPLDLMRNDDDCFDLLDISSRPFLLTSGMFVLGATAEKFSSSHYLAEILGCSSTARKAVGVEDAGFIERGFHGNITLELRCAIPEGVYLHAGCKIAQLKFVWAGQAEDYQIRGHYRDASDHDGPMLSRSHLQTRRHHP